MNRWSVAAGVYAALVVAVLAYFLLRLPVQLSDSYGNLVQASQGTLWSLLEQQFRARAFLRPFLWGLIRVVFDLSGGHYYEWFRGWHVCQVAVLAILFLRLVRPVTPAGAAVVPLGLAVLLGVHTFTGTVVEAFPINTFMTILLCMLAAADIAMGPPRWWRDVAAAAIFIFAALTVETGLLVPVVFVAAFAAGARGVSRTGVAAQVALVGAYFALRFVVLRVGTPGMDERSSGFGFSFRDPAELSAIFGAHPILFYAYNVVSSVLSVLFAEPRAGVWRFASQLAAGTPPAGQIVNVLASAIATGLLGWFVWTRRAAWRSRRFERADQLVIVFLAVLPANAAIAYAYSKDVILSPAGALLAVAVAAAARQLLESVPRMRRSAAAMALVTLTVLSCTWSIRAVGLHVVMRRAAANTATDWAYADSWLEGQHLTPATPFETALKTRLQDDAVRRHPVTYLRPAWNDWFEDH